MAHPTRVQTVGRDSAASPAPVDADAIARLSDRYAFRRPDEVISYLQRYPHLVPVPNEVADRVPEYFDDEVTLALEMYFDTEYDDREGALFASIQVAPYDDAAFDRLERFGDDWWYLASPPGPGTVVIDVEPAQHVRLFGLPRRGQ